MDISKGLGANLSLSEAVKRSESTHGSSSSVFSSPWEKGGGLSRPTQGIVHQQTIDRENELITAREVEIYNSLVSGGQRRVPEKRRQPRTSHRSKNRQTLDDLGRSAPRVAYQTTTSTVTRRAANAAEQRVRDALPHPLSGRVHKHNRDIWGHPSTHLDDTVTEADPASKSLVGHAVVPGAAPYGVARRPGNMKTGAKGSKPLAPAPPPKAASTSARHRAGRGRAQRNRELLASDTLGVKLHGLSAVGITKEEAEHVDAVYRVSEDAHQLLSQYLGFADLTSPDAADLLGDLFGEALRSASSSAMVAIQRDPQGAWTADSGKALAWEVWQAALRYAQADGGTPPTLTNDVEKGDPPDVCIALCCDALDKLSERWAGDHGAGRIMDVIKAGLFAAVYEDYAGSPIDVIAEAETSAGDANAHRARGPPAAALPRTESMQLLSHVREAEWDTLSPEQRAALGQHSAPYFLGRRTRVAANAELRARVASLEEQLKKAKDAGPQYVKEVMGKMKLVDRRELMVEMLQERPDPRVVEELFDTLRGRASGIALENMLRAAGREARTSVINKLLLDLPRGQLRPIVDTVIARATTKDKRYILRALLSLHPELLKDELLAASAMHLHTDAPDTANEDAATATARRILGSVLGPVRKLLSNNIEFASDFFRDHRSLLLRLFRRDPDLLEDVIARDETLLTFVSTEGQQAIGARNMLLMRAGVADKARIRRSSRPSVTRHKKYSGYHARSTGSSDESGDEGGEEAAEPQDGQHASSRIAASSPHSSTPASALWLQHASGRNLNPTLGARKSILIAARRASASLRVRASAPARSASPSAAGDMEEMWDLDAESVVSLGSSVTASSNDAEVLEADAVAVLGRGPTGRVEEGEKDQGDDESVHGRMQRTSSTKSSTHIPPKRPLGAHSLSTVTSGMDVDQNEAPSVQFPVAGADIAHPAPENDTTLSRPASMRRQSTAPSSTGAQWLLFDVFTWDSGFEADPTKHTVTLSRDTVLLDVRRVAADLIGRGEEEAASIAMFSHGTELDKGMDRASLKQLGFKDDSKMDPAKRTFVALDHFQCTQVFSLRRQDMQDWNEGTQWALKAHVFGAGMEEAGIVPLVLSKTEDATSPALPAPLVEAVMGCGETQRQHVVAATTTSKASSRFYYSQLPANVREQLQFATPDQRTTVAILLLRSSNGASRAGGFRRAKALLNARMRMAKESLTHVRARLDNLRKSAPSKGESVQEDKEAMPDDTENGVSAKANPEASIAGLAEMEEETIADVTLEERRLATDVDELRRVMASLETTRTWGVVQLRQRIHHLQQLLFQAPEDEDILHELELAQHDLKEGVDVEASTEESESESSEDEDGEGDGSDADSALPAEPNPNFTEASDNVTRIAPGLVEIRWFWATFLVTEASAKQTAVDAESDADEDEDDVDDLTPLPEPEPKLKRTGKSSRRRLTSKSFRKKKGQSGRLPDSIARLLSTAGAEALGKSDVHPLPLQSLEKIIRSLLAERFHALWQANDECVATPLDLPPLPPLALEAAQVTGLGKLVWRTNQQPSALEQDEGVSDEEEDGTVAEVVEDSTAGGVSGGAPAPTLDTTTSAERAAQIARVSRGLARGSGRGKLWGSSANLYVARQDSPENSGDESVHTFQVSDLGVSSTRPRAVATPKSLVSKPLTSQASSQLLCEHVFHSFLHKYGLRKLAERNVVRLVASVLAHQDKSRIVHAFGRLLGLYSPVDGRTMDAVFGVLGCLERQKAVNPTTVDDGDSGITLVAVVRAQRAFREAFGNGSTSTSSEASRASAAIGKAAVSERQAGGTAMVALDDVMLIAMDAFFSYRAKLDSAAEALFTACDVDDDGLVSRSEVCSVLRTVAPWLSSPEMHALVSAHTTTTSMTVLSDRRQETERVLTRNGSALVLEKDDRKGEGAVPPSPSAHRRPPATLDGSDISIDSDASLSTTKASELPALARTTVESVPQVGEIDVVSKEAFVRLLTLQTEVSPALPVHIAARIRAFQHRTVASLLGAVPSSDAATVPQAPDAQVLSTTTLQDLLDPASAVARLRALEALDPAAAEMWQALISLSTVGELMRFESTMTGAEDGNESAEAVEADDAAGTSHRFGTSTAMSKLALRQVKKGVRALLSSPWLRCRVGGPPLVAAAQAATEGGRKAEHASFLLALREGLPSTMQGHTSAYDVLDQLWRQIRPLVATYIERLVAASQLPPKHGAVCVHQSHPLLQHRIARFVRVRHNHGRPRSTLTRASLASLCSCCVCASHWR